MRRLFPNYIGGPLDGVAIAGEMVERYAPKHRFMDNETPEYRRVAVTHGPHRVDGYVVIDLDPSDAAARLLEEVLKAATIESPLTERIDPHAATEEGKDDRARDPERSPIGDPHRRP